MSELISDVEALTALKNGEDVEYLEDDNKWNLIDKEFVVISALLDCKLRLKPRTITINDVEVPACGTNYKPHTFMFVLNSLEPCEYSKIILDESDEIPPYWWKSEDEIKQVVAALRSVFNVK